MNHLIIAPILLPAFTAAFIVLALRDDLRLQRIVSGVATAALLALGIYLYALAADGETRPYLLGNWPVPFGIILVLDRLSALMVLLTGILGLVVVAYASGGWDEKGRHFHALFQFQLMGIMGAFLTGDAFNLFVFFEVMLIASYGLMLHGGGPARLKAGFHYVTINLIGSTLFLFAIGLIYATTGTLNMADIARRSAEVAAGDVALLRVGALLLFLVFALKSSLAPLHWWLPTTYGAASAPAAAIFAIMTKVGAYSIIRMHAMVFGPEAGEIAWTAAPWIIPAALVTLLVGALGVLATRRLVDLVAFSVVWSMGSLLVALGLFDVEGLTAALYYAVHSTVAAAVLFLIADMVTRRRGASGDALRTAPPVGNDALLSGLFFVAAIAMAGLPPFSGFIGKLLILDAARASAYGPWIWALVLVTSLVVIIGFARAGSTLFWKAQAVGGGLVAAAPPPEREFDTPRKETGAMRLSVYALLAFAALLVVFAGPATEAFEATARQILDPAGYVAAVFDPAIVPDWSR
ncbi:monovalent cation/H+ antiporter subunit D [Salinarimonas ramus]|nr:monovalent cation/H+ antiporter subunit D [Salinarimonas ramus]